MEDKTVSRVARRHSRTNAQVLIRWSLQQGFIPLPKSSNPDRQRSNLDVYSFELNDRDMEVRLLCICTEARNICTSVPSASFS